MLKRLTITFEPEEAAALSEMAEADLRYPKEQLRLILRQEAERRGILPVKTGQEGRREPAA